MSRPIVQYDDISLPYTPPSAQGPPPAKKRKKNNNRNKQQRQQAQTNDEDNVQNLTHNEIWDDTALVLAWDSAMEEYDRFHGPGQDWKTEPVNKSPLWYNAPSKQNSTVRETDDAEDPQGNDDSMPLNFDTFVPTHDPSLESAPTISKPNDASVDEAFEQAMNAMYWTGYWTAVYHQKRGVASREEKETSDEEVADEEEVEGELEEEEDVLVSTQR